MKRQVNSMQSGDESQANKKIKIKVSNRMEPLDMPDYDSELFQAASTMVETALMTPAAGSEVSQLTGDEKKPKQAPVLMVSSL